MIEITLLGTGSPLVDPRRAGPATLVRAGGRVFLFDCGRGVLMRAAAVGVQANQLTAEHFAGRIELGDDLHRVVVGDES